MGKIPPDAEKGDEEDRKVGGVELPDEADGAHGHSRKR
jgi:hypothetical protein